MADIAKEWDRIEELLHPDEVHKGVRIVRRCMETGEPFFVLRAKDLLSVMALYNYAEINEKFGPLDDQFQQDILSITAKFKQWQSENADKVRYAD